MVPPEDGGASEAPGAGGEAAAWPVIAEEEWQAIFRRTVAVRGPTAEPQSVPTDPGEQSPEVASERVDPASGDPSARVSDPLDFRAPPALDATPPAALAERVEPVRRAPERPPALTDQEWRDRFFQRGSLTGLVEGEDLLILTAPDVVAGVTSIRLHGDALAAVAAAALRQGPGGFGWQDYDDLVLLATALDEYRRGIPLEGRGGSDQEAISAVTHRLSGLIARVGALLPPR